MKAIINGKFIIPDETGCFTVEEEPHSSSTRRYGLSAPPPPSRRPSARSLEACIDARGAYVSPGFLNVHIHGCVGADTMDDDPEAIRKMQLFQARTGVTAFLPTTMTYDFPTLGRAFRHVREAMAREEGARVLGCHMEGPFISPAKKGAQAEKNIAKADFAKIAPYQDIVKIITVAPEELHDGGQFIADCHAHGIVVSLGHTAADYATARQAIEEYGAKHITHLFNAMTGLHQRRPGVVGAALDTDANCEAHRRQRPHPSGSPAHRLPAQERPPDPHHRLPARLRPRRRPLRGSADRRSSSRERSRRSRTARLPAACSA